MSKVQSSSKRSASSHWSHNAAFVLLLLSIVALSSVGGYLYHHKQAPSVGNMRIVTFDVTRMANAQRAIAAGLLDGNTDVVVRLSRIGKETEAAIREAAGPNALILVKQAVVFGENIPDITDEVLRRLELPTNVPTIDPAKYLTQDAPTELSVSASKLINDANIKARAERQNNRAAKLRNEASEDLLP